MAKRAQSPSTPSGSASQLNRPSRTRRLVRGLRGPTAAPGSDSGAVARVDRLLASLHNTANKTKNRQIFFAMLREIYAYEDRSLRPAESNEAIRRLKTEIFPSEEEPEEEVQPLTRQPEEQVQPLARQTVRRPVLLADDTGLRSRDSTYEVSIANTNMHSNIDYYPSRALLHQFGGMNHQTVVAYGENKIQLWDPFSPRVVGVLDRRSAGLPIAQIEPVSPSVLAMVSLGHWTTEQPHLSSELRFTKVSRPNQDGQFSMTTSEPWVPDKRLESGISVIDSVNPESPSNTTRVSLFTGGLADTQTGGNVYRRIFDISGSTARMVQSQKMDKRHRGRVTALCNVEAGNYIVSGNTKGDIYCHDLNTGACIQDISLGDDNDIIGNITSCPFSQNLYMVGRSDWKYDLRIYDKRDTQGDNPKLVIKDRDSTITSPTIRPAWDSATGLIFVPMRRNTTKGNALRVINVWDPRFLSSRMPMELRLSGNTNDVISIEVLRSAVDRDPVMVTASSDSIAFTTLTCNVT